MSMDTALQTYFIESRELLESMESHLLRLERGDAGALADSLNAIFRAAHTIKGSAGLFGLDAIVAFTHVVESVLDQLREGNLHLNEPLTSLLLRCQDHIGTLVEEAESGTADTEASHSLSHTLTDELELYLKSVAARTHSSPASAMARYAQHLSDPTCFDLQPQFADRQGERTAKVDRIDSVSVDNDHWHISLRFGENTFRNGMDPLSFLGFLGGMGETVQIVTLADQIPDVDAFNPETCYLGFEIRFRSNASKQEIEDVFEFVREDCQIRILPPSSKLSDYLELIESLPEVDLKIGEILLECGALTSAELAAALACQRERRERNDEQSLGEILTARNTQLSPVLEAAVRKQSQVRESIAREHKSLRVDADKLDTLINLVGELVTAGAGTALQAQASEHSDVIESVSVLNSLLEDVRDAALRLRMVQIGATFSRFQRVVRDIARELNKDVELVITGADTELDKSVVEKLGDPLTHLVRNALDHGIEPADIRVERGKPAKGRLSLNAYHDAGNIVIEVADDGKGLDPQAIRARAQEKGLIADEQILGREEIFDLIFEPGFSTASQVSNLSGRGVGMDVVKRNITELRGRIEIDSEPGCGTTVRIILPLTLAIIDGFLIGVEDDAFVVPLDVVQECVELTGAEVSTDACNNPYINLRGNVLPLINLRQYFAVGGSAPRRQSVVVVQTAGQTAGLVVDRLMGEFQTVIKPLGTIFGNVCGVSGSTIIGSGEVALILDIRGLTQNIINEEQRQTVAVA